MSRPGRRSASGLLALSVPFLVLAGVTAQPDTAGVRAAVEQANSPAVWGEALRRGDPAPLARVWAGEPLEYFAGEVLAYRARGLRLVSTLVGLDFLDVDLDGDGRALATTREEWRDWICADDGTPRGTRWARVRDRYALAWQAGQWWVHGVEIELEQGGFDWRPVDAASEARSPCAGVVD